MNGVDRSNPLTSLDTYSASTFIAGIVVGLMITPIAGSIMREAFGQAPVGEREGALRARRHPVGDDQGGRAAVRPGRDDRRH